MHHYGVHNKADLEIPNYQKNVMFEVPVFYQKTIYVDQRKLLIALRTILHNLLWFMKNALPYRPSSMENVSSFLECDSGLVEDEEVVPERCFLEKKAGSFGFGRVAVSLPSMKSTLDMVGRSPGSS